MHQLKMSVCLRVKDRMVHIIPQFPSLLIHEIPSCLSDTTPGKQSLACGQQPAEKNPYRSYPNITSSNQSLQCSAPNVREACVCCAFLWSEFGSCIDHPCAIVCVCVVAAVDRGLEVTDSQLQGQQRVPHDLPEETVSERVARLAWANISPGQWVTSATSLCWVLE